MTTNQPKKIVLTANIGSVDFLLIGPAPRKRRPCWLTHFARCIARWVWLALRINMQDYSCDFFPVSNFVLSLKQANVRHDMLLVIGR